MKDPYDNRDLFIKDIPDGICSIRCGYLGAKAQPLLFVGSNCSIQAFDHTGEEQYWNITGDNVLSFCFCDVDEDELYELIVGCEDNTIMIFKELEIKHEIIESSPVTFLASFGYEHFGFALRNRHYGIYEKNVLLWKERYKEGVVGMCSIFSDGDEEGLAVGFRNGRIETRKTVDGSIIHHLMVGGQLSGILRSNFVKSLDEEQILAIRRSGEITGYNVRFGELATSSKSGVDDSELVEQIKKLEEERNSLRAMLGGLKNRSKFFFYIKNIFFFVKLIKRFKTWKTSNSG